VLESVLIFTPVCAGLYLVLSGFFPRVNVRAERAVKARAGKKESISTALVNKIAVQILPLFSIEDMKRQSLQRSLDILGWSESPELFRARAWATGILYGAGVLAFTPVFHLLTLVLFPGVIRGAAIYQLGVFAAIAMLFVGRHAVTSELEKEIVKRREAIEWELPQFAGTVLQSLGHTRNVIDILESYRKICGDSLKHEIDQTLNEMRTGNHETALKNLAARINSGSFTQLAQGLIGLLRGDDQSSYFQIITKDFSKNQQELIKKELLKRPGRLTINNVLLLAGMMLMLFVAIGGYLMDTSAGLF